MKNYIRNFTIIELLVVISVIAILAAMLLPSLNNARETGKRASCSNNLRQLGLANLNYLDDYKTFAPLDANNYTGAVGDAAALRWYGSTVDTGTDRRYSRKTSPLFSYLAGNTKVFDCPALRIDSNASGPERGAGGYGYNDYVGTHNPCPNNKSQANRQSGCYPKQQLKFSSRLMFADVASVLDASGNIQSSGSVGGRIAEDYHIIAPKTCMGGDNGRPTLHFRHPGLNANVVWCDGHVTSQRLEFSRNGFSEYHLGWFGPDSNDYFGKMGSSAM